MNNGFKLVLLWVGLLLFSTLGAHAWIFVVTETNDTTCLTSLRGAIIAANFLGGKNTIILGQTIGRQRNQPREWVYHLTIPGANETNSRTGDLNINRGDLTITGVSSNVVIDATGLGDRVFQVSSRAQLTLSRLIIEGGAAPQAQEGSFYSRTFGSGSGGAICNGGILTLDACVITNNSSGGGNSDPGNGGGSGAADGGGIYSSGTMSASNCVIAGNFAGTGFDGTPGGNGGGLGNDGKCTLSHCMINGNQSGAGGGPMGNAGGFAGWGGGGGGVYNSGTMVLDQCVVSENLSGQGANGGQAGISSVDSGAAPGGDGGGGAGIYNSGQMQLNFSTVNGNRSGNGGNGGNAGYGGNGGAGGSGAGIFNAGSLSASTTTISGNSAGNAGNGGNGLWAGGIGGAGGHGGGIYSGAPPLLIAWIDNYTGAFFYLTSCTIALNQSGIGGNSGDSSLSSAAAAGGSGGSGGGVFNGLNSTNAIVRNSLIALNTSNVGGIGGTNFQFLITAGQQPTQQIGNPGADGIGFDVAGDFTSQGFNLISAADGSTGFTGGLNADQAGTVASPINPELGPLQMNGGPTPTHALLSGSPAVDQGNCFGIHTDQRGYYRPHIIEVSPEPPMPEPPGGDGSDIGAFELDATK
jgi:hypothetical protein